MGNTRATLPAWVTTLEPLDAHADSLDRLPSLFKESIETIHVGIGFGGPAMLTDRAPDFTKLRGVHARQRRELEAVIDAGKADGSFRTDIDAETLVAAIVGAHIAERVRTGRVAAGWESRLFDVFWPTVRA